MRTSVDELGCNIIGTRGGDAYIVSTHETENLRAWEAELRSKRDTTTKPSDKLMFGKMLSTIHFDQRLGDWLKEVKLGFQIADGNYLDYAYVLVYRAGLSGEKACRFMGIEKPRGGHRSANWKKIRNEILKRDNYTCSQCGSRENLDVHHIGWWWDNSPSNFTTLCSRCHHSLT